jgi:hypothetical protein
MVLFIEVPVTACDKSVYPGHTEQPFLFHQPCDGSMFDIFITGEMIASQVLLKEGNKRKLLGVVYGQSEGCKNVSQPNSCSTFCVCCAVCSWAMSWRRVKTSLWRRGYLLLPTSGSPCSTAATVLPYASNRMT